MPLIGTFDKKFVVFAVIRGYDRTSEIEGAAEAALARNTDECPDLASDTYTKEPGTCNPALRGLRAESRTQYRMPDTRVGA